VILRIKVNTNSDSFGIGQINKWTGRLKISVKSPARKNKANQELLNKLEERLKRQVKLLNGHKSNKKRILIKGSTTKEVRDSLLD